MLAEPALVSGALQVPRLLDKRGHLLLSDEVLKELGAGKDDVLGLK